MSPTIYSYRFNLLPSVPLDARFLSMPTVAHVIGQCCQLGFNGYTAAIISLVTFFDDAVIGKKSLVSSAVDDRREGYWYGLSFAGTD